MPVDAKICGLKTAETVDAAVSGGAFMIGFNFFARSPRYLSPALAGELGKRVPASTGRVGLVVDAGDDEIAAILNEARLDLLQLHGKETPDRVAAVKARFGLPVMKVISVAEAADIASARAYEDVADRLMFDTKPPKSMSNALPGGNAISFDWSLLRGQSFGLPWMLAGGLHAGNLAQAVKATGAPAVDTSSGVEDRPGKKSINKIKEFLAIAQSL
ncbi:MAG: phosphoribosylanthranilate isomerase [Rhodospirillaceae bacterium]|nr:phosphoribosylanthranilate isomerase [Rhodospirillaceae bacterium]